MEPGWAQTPLRVGEGLGLHQAKPWFEFADPRDRGQLRGADQGQELV